MKEHNNIFYPDKYEECAVIKALLSNRTWEKKIVSLFKKYLQKGDVAIDVGSFIGLHSLKLSDIVGEDGKVYAIEAIRPIYDCVVATVTQKQISNIEPLNFALHDLPNIPLTFLSDHTGESSVEEHRRRPFKYKYTINSTTLDEYFLPLNLDKINLMKIDVEGHEFKVLKGGEKLINKYRPVIIMESWPRKKNLLNLSVWAVDNDYMIEKINNENYLLLPKRD